MTNKTIYLLIGIIAMFLLFFFSSCDLPKSREFFINPKYLLFLSTGTLGIFVGAQIAEGVLLVPFWKDLPAEDFFKFHQTYGKKLYQFFAPLTIITTVAALVATVNGMVYKSQNQLLLMTMGMATLVFFLTYFLYFKKANQQFKEAGLSNPALSKELIRWEQWHWGRIVFEMIAFVCSLCLLMES